MKKRIIALDADPLIFEVAEGKNTNMRIFGAEVGDVADSNYKEPLKPYKDKLKLLIKDIENEIAAQYPGEIKKIKPIFSDPKKNFRYDIYPEYKANRKEMKKSKLFYRLRKWALKKYTYVENLEADDYVSYLVLNKNAIGATIDKDMLKGVAGDWFDTYHDRRTMKSTSVGEARNFNLLQTLMGDPTDNIKGIPGVGEKNAIKLLDTYGWTWDGVLKAYQSKGLSQDDMELNARLVLLNQWTPKNGVKLWSYEDESNKRKN